MRPHDDTDRVTVLMATQNGARYLDEQMDSLERQTHSAIDIVVSDDGSTDATPALLEAWSKRWTKGRFVVVAGPGKGFAENFRSLLAASRSETAFYAFCDQDDLWEPDKLARAIAWLGNEDVPRLFCSRTRLIAETGEAIGLSVLFARQPSFRNALVQSIAGGNTMVFNRAAHALLALASSRSSFVSHDWWSYLIVSGAGGAVTYSAEPLVRYRQHQQNVVGANTGIAARLTRLRRLLRGDFSTWTAINVKALAENRDLLTDDARTAFDHFAAARFGGMIERVRSLRASGVYRQSPVGDVALYLAVIGGRL